LNKFSQVLYSSYANIKSETSFHHGSLIVVEVRAVRPTPQRSPEEVLRWIGADHRPIPSSTPQVKHCSIAIKLTKLLLRL